MKKDIHPKYFDKATVRCACGQTFTLGSTTEKMEIEICSHCHPFYTGEKKLIDTAGRAEKFKARVSKATTQTKIRKISKVRKKTPKKSVVKKIS
jgi:large subunit ribosomal protein L31